MLRSAFLALLLPLAAGCAALGSVPGAQTDDRVLVSASWLAQNVSRPEVVVLHVARERAHYSEGHIPGAHYVPLSAFAVDRGNQVNVLPETGTIQQALRAAGVSDGSHVVLYGDLDGLAAARAFFALDVHGFGQGTGRLSVLDGGLRAWRSAGGAVQAAATPAPRAGTVSLALRSDLVLSAASVEARRGQAQTVLVDARPPAQHSGAEPGEGIRRPGHIPGSVNLFWQDDTRSDGTLRSPAELRARYTRAGVVPGREVITYCRTGVQAAHAYLVARYLGFRPLLYDGSFHDWSNNTSYPVARG
ncbi:MAG: sulfurtransferase [Rubricoccaceae bacterium]